MVVAGREERNSVGQLWFVSASVYYSDTVHVENINYYLHPVAQNEKKAGVIGSTQYLM